jgi:methionine synthase II (cobalamin-independent)
MQFRINDWISHLKDELIEEIENESILNDDDVQTHIHEYIDNSCIYYKDCMEIIDVLNAYDFGNFELECTTIPQVAYCALMEETYEHDFSFDNLKNSIDD